MDSAALTVYWGPLCKRPKVQDVHFPDLRHTFATRLQNFGAGLEVRLALLGHKVRGPGNELRQQVWLRLLKAYPAGNSLRPVSINLFSIIYRRSLATSAGSTSSPMSSQ